jgi:hypothetical protein
VKKPGIPEVRLAISQEIRSVLEPLKETVEIITAQRVYPIRSLPLNATDRQIIEKINEILDRLQ